MEEHEVNPLCEARTDKALGLGKGWKMELEKQILIAKHEREMQMASLGASLQLMSSTVTGLATTVASDHEVTMGIQRQLISLGNWQVEESKRHDQEELEKKAAIAEVEQARKDRIKPWQEVLWGAVKTVVIFALGIIATAVWNQYFIK